MATISEKGESEERGVRIIMARRGVRNGCVAEALFSDIVIFLIYPSSRKQVEAGVGARDGMTAGVRFGREARCR